MIYKLLPDSEPELWVMLGKLGGSRHHAPGRRPARLDRRLPLAVARDAAGIAEAVPLHAAHTPLHRAG